MVFRDAASARQSLFRNQRILSEMEKIWTQPENKGMYIVGYEDNSGVHVELYYDEEKATERAKDIPEHQRPSKEMHPFYIPKEGERVAYHPFK